MRDADVVVVGAGLSGVLVARSLARHGHDVVALDAGARLRGAPADAPGFERAVKPHLVVDDKLWSYENARQRTQYRWLRVRAVGGRTLSWGAWMDRPDAAYFESRRQAGHPWPFTLAALSPWLARAERELGVRTGRLHPLFQPLKSVGLDVSPKREAVLVRGMRAATALDFAGRMRIIERAVALRVLSDVTGAARGVECIIDGTATRIGARAVVLAASPVETARILHHTPRAPARGLGGTIHDHLVAGAIAIAPAVDIPERKRGEPDPAGATVLPGARDDVRMTIEIRGPKPLTSLDDEDLAALGFDRKGARAHALYAVFALAETDPDAQRRLWFDDLRPDFLGRALPVFDVAGLTARERETVRTMKLRVREVAQLVGGKLATVYLIRDPRELGEVGHECGTCPMGRASDSIVDATGAVHGMRGVFIADASPLPGALDRHPSLTLAAYALRTADAVHRELRRG